MKRTVMLLAVEAIVIVGLLVPAVAFGVMDVGGSGNLDAAEQITALKLQVETLESQVSIEVNHLHMDAHAALGTPPDNVDELTLGPHTGIGTPYKGIGN